MTPIIGRADRENDSNEALFDAFRAALVDATQRFKAEHGRDPQWDEVNIGGGATTFEVLVEIMSDGPDSP